MIVPPIKTGCLTGGLPYQHTFYQFLFPLLRHRPADPTDFLRSLEACLAHDGTGLLGRIRGATLVIGGTEDTFFPRSFLCEASERIPEAKLVLVEGTGHGAYEEQQGNLRERGDRVRP